VRFILAANQGDSESFILTIEVACSSETPVLIRQHGLILSQRTAFFIVIAVKTANVTGLTKVHSENNPVLG
jgi:hypothetical protein